MVSPPVIINVGNARMVPAVAGLLMAPSRDGDRLARTMESGWPSARFGGCSVLVIGGWLRSVRTLVSPTIQAHGT